jgi:hypothetical protein
LRTDEPLNKIFKNVFLHRYHSRLIPEGVAEASQITRPK